MVGFIFGGFIFILGLFCVANSPAFLGLVPPSTLACFMPPKERRWQCVACCQRRGKLGGTPTFSSFFSSFFLGAIYSHVAGTTGTSPRTSLRLIVYGAHPSHTRAALGRDDGTVEASGPAVAGVMGQGVLTAACADWCLQSLPNNVWCRRGSPLFRAAAISCASLAAADAGIEMTDLVAACRVVSTDGIVRTACHPVPPNVGA